MIKFNKNKFVYKYIDDNFWIDFINDTCNLDITIYLDAFYKNIRKALKYINPKTKTRDIDSKTWNKIFLHKNIDYSCPITYKYFKEVICQTYTLANFMHLHIDLYNSIQEIQTTCKYPIDSIIRFDLEYLLQYIILLRIDINAQNATFSDIFELIENTENIQNSWLNKKEYSYDYWLWLWIFIELSNNCFDTLYNIKNEFIKYYKEFITQLEGIDFDNVEDERKPHTKQKAHNAYSIQENTNWLRCRNIYNACKSQYTIVKLLTESIIKNLSQQKIKKAAQKFNFDEHDLTSLNNAIENLFPIEENIDFFVKYKNYLEDNFIAMYQILFDIKHFQNFNEIYLFLKNISKQECCLLFIKHTFPHTKNKSDKTILNIISNVEYNIKHNKTDIYNPCNQFDNIDDFANKNIYQVCQILIEKITNKFFVYLKTPNDDSLKDIRNYLSILKHIKDDLKKSQAKNW